ncbi:MAG: HAMP domain-containing sensor histidine kinase, partial [Bacillota bacterium]|nr:HAMP domain-containing sensor histidine kinase [Bacillota bacterium]
GFVETLKSNDLPAEKRDKALDVIEGESRRLQEMISKLLVLSHVERHRNTNPVLFNLGELLREILAMMRPLASERSIRIEDQNPIPRIDVINDPELIKIVLVNLIDNAIKYNVDGGEVRVAILEEGDHFIASVSDTGVGIPPKDLEHIFERFYRVDRNRNISPGSGLGLSISKHVLLTLGGEIKAESELGVGTKFTIRVPRLHAQS